MFVYTIILIHITGPCPVQDVNCSRQVIVYILVQDYMKNRTKPILYLYSLKKQHFKMSLCCKRVLYFSWPIEVRLSYPIIPMHRKLFLCKLRSILIKKYRILIYAITCNCLKLSIFICRTKTETYHLKIGG